MFDPTLHPTMFSPLQVLGDLQQCLSQPYPSKKSGVCLNHNNHVWQNKIKFIWCWQSRANTRNGFWPACIEAKICLPSISCLCKLLLLKADEADDVPAKYYFMNHLQSVSILGPSISVPFLPWLSILIVERGVHFGIGMSGELLMMMRNLMDTVSMLESEWCGTGWGVMNHYH